MNVRESFSVYEPRACDAERDQEHPLADLVPVDREGGWHVARNLLKPLNHLGFLRRQEYIATQLNLHNVFTSSELFEYNFGMLEDHQSGKISTDRLIDHLASQLRRQGSSLAEQDIRHMLRMYAHVRHMEFHPSDICNLRCRGCTYGHDNPEWKPLPVNFPFSAIQRIAHMKPLSMVIIGGGEPTLYKDAGRSFQDMVDEIFATNPGLRIALVTNGTFMPSGKWPNRFSWIRLSLDAATAGIYSDFRGKPMFDQVMRSFLGYLDYAVPYVGISFLFAKSNIHEYAAVAKYIFDLVKREKPHALNKVNIQYRPLRRDPYRYDEAFTEAVTEEQIERAVNEVRMLADSSTEMKSFLRNQTNITAIVGGNGHPSLDFRRCYYSQTFKIVRANGDLRPCFIRVMEPNFVLGNIITDRLEKIALNTLYVGARRQPHCDAHGCRQCHVNYTFELGLDGDLLPSTSPAVVSDPMY